MTLGQETSVIEILGAGVLQFLFQLSRTFSTRLISKEHMLGTMIMTFIIQVLWLVTTAIGVKAVFDIDWWTISSYMIGGLFGAYIAMRVDIKEKIKG